MHTLCLHLKCRLKLCAILYVTVVSMRATRIRSYPAECAEQSGHSGGKESSKQSL